MQQTQGKLASERRRGGGSSVTLLFVAAAASAAAVFWLTRTFIAPADVIAPFVPGNAVAYLHASGRRATDFALASSVQMPSGVAPDEVAVFATPGDDALRWGVIVAWRQPRVPSPAERAALAGRGAVALDRYRFLIGDASLAVSSRVAAAAHASLADDPKKRKALALVRSIAAVQAYADPASFLTPETAGLLAGISVDAASPLVAGMSLSQGMIRVRVLPLDAAADAWSPLGYRAAASHGGNAAAIGRFTAQVAIAEDAPSFDVAKLIADVPRAEDHPSPSLLGLAGEDLRSVLALPYLLWLRPVPADGRVEFLLRFPTAAPDAVKKALARYAAAIEPDRTIFRLPDGGAVTEFRLDEEARIAKMGSGDAFVELGKDAGSSVAVGNDGSGGTLIASAAELMAEYRRAKPSPQKLDDCEAGNLGTAIVLNEPAATLSAIPQATKAVDLFGLKTLMLGTSADREILICGYK